MVHTRARRLAAPQTPSAQLGDDEDEPEDGFDSDPPPRAKRRKVSASKTATTAAKKVDKGKGKVRGKTGKLAFILDAPTEIVLGILSYLTPIDILNLSYVDKELRAMMTSPSSKSIWVAARQNVPGLPECPVDFTESAYARFLFLSRCELCGGVAHGLTNMCFVRIRLCSRCDKKKCVSSLGLFFSRYVAQDKSDWKLIPRALYYTDVDLPTKANVVFEPALERLRERMSQIPEGDERENFVKERREFIEKVMDHAKMLSVWFSNVRKSKEELADDIRDERRRNILTRLEALGYDRRDMAQANVLRHRVIRQTVQLTDKLWPNVLRHLEPIVQTNRLERHRREGRTRILGHLKTRFLAMWNSLTTPLEKYTYIPMLDFLELPAVTSIIEASLVDAPNIDVDQFNISVGSNIAAINEEILQFRMKMRKDLFILWTKCNAENDISGIMEALEADNITIGDRMHLATTTFQFNKLHGPGCVCRQLIHYATLFKAPFHRDPCLFATILTPLDIQPNLKYKWSYYLPRMTSNQISTAHMQTIVREAGLDVEASTLQDLENLGSYCPIKEDGDINGSQSPNASRASPMTTWLAEYNRLIGPVATSNTVHAQILTPYGFEDEIYSEYGYHSDDSYDSYDSAMS